MKIEKYVVGMIGTNCYLVIGSISGKIKECRERAGTEAEGCTSDTCTF